MRLTKEHKEKIQRASDQELKTLLEGGDLPENFVAAVQSELERRGGLQEAPTKVDVPVAPKVQVKLVEAPPEPEAPKPKPVQWYQITKGGLVNRNGFVCDVNPGTLFPEGSYVLRDLEMGGIEYKKVSGVTVRESQMGFREMKVS